MNSSDINLFCRCLFFLSKILANLCLLVSNSYIVSSPRYFHCLHCLLRSHYYLSYTLTSKQHISHRKYFSFRNWVSRLIFCALLNYVYRVTKIYHIDFPCLFKEISIRFSSKAYTTQHRIKGQKI